VQALTDLRIGSVDLALVDSVVLQNAIQRREAFRFLDIRYESLRALAPLYRVPVSLVARKAAGIESLDDLKGGRINAGAPGTPQRRAVNAILEAKNWSKGDFQLFQELPSSQSQDSMAFCHGTIQAMVHAGVHPDESLEQLLRLCDAALVDMGDEDVGRVVEGHPAWTRTRIPADTYPMISEPVTGFGTTVVLVVAEDLGEAEAHRIVDALYRGRDRMENAHPALSILGATAGEEAIAGIPLHPAAAAFFTGLPR
jgi:TRAP transporter TAXI family solute receptor